MSRTPAYLCLLLTCMLISQPYARKEKHEIDYTSYVNPFIGTDFTGNTYPGAQAPFGMVQLSPDNGLPGWDHVSGYFLSGQYDCWFSLPHIFPALEREICMTSLSCLSLFPTKKRKHHLASILNSPTRMKVLMPVIIKNARLIININVELTTNLPGVVLSNVIRFRKPNLLSS